VSPPEGCGGRSKSREMKRTRPTERRQRARVLAGGGQVLRSGGHPVHASLAALYVAVQASSEMGNRSKSKSRDLLRRAC
jgi:hypothetical protein